MSVLHEARKRVKALVPDAKHIVALDEALDAIGDLAKHKAEAGRERDVSVAAKDVAERELAVALKDLAAAKGDVNAAKKAAQETEAQAVQRLDAAAGTAEETMKAARVDADAILAKAKADGDALVAQARADVQAILDGSRAEESRLHEIKELVAIEQGKLDAINAEITNMRRKFA